MKLFLRKSAFVGAALALLGGLLPVASRAQTQTDLRLYGVTFFSNQLINIDPATGAGSLIGPLGANVSPYGLATRFDRLYTFDQNTDRIHELNLSTGGILQTIDIGVGDLLGEGDLAFRSDGTGFLASALNPATFTTSNDLFRFDIATGTSTRIGSTSVTLDGLAFGAGDVLYGLGQSDASLYVIDQTTAATTLVGNLGITKGSPFAGLTFGPNGTLYAAVDDRLFTVNTLTGAATPVNRDVTSIGFSSVSGVAFAPIPEPSSVLLFGLGTTGLLALRRRKR